MNNDNGVARTMDLLRRGGFRITDLTLENVTFWVEQRKFTPERIALDIYGIKPEHIWA